MTFGDDCRNTNDFRLVFHPQETIELIALHFGTCAPLWHTRNDRIVRFHTTPIPSDFSAVGETELSLSVARLRGIEIAFFQWTNTTII